MKFDLRGYMLSVPFLILALVLHYFKSYRASIPALFISVLVLVFHRIPRRKTPNSGIVSPTDGRITDVQETEDYVEFSTYLGLSDVHVFHSPCNSRITEVKRIDGSNKPAFLNVSEKNERLLYEFQNGIEVVVMTGFIARRIKTYVREQDVSRGDRLGIISFGSRANIRVPKSEFGEINVEEGDKLTGGESVVAN